MTYVAGTISLEFAERSHTRIPVPPRTVTPSHYEFHLATHDSDARRRVCLEIDALPGCLRHRAHQNMVSRKVTETIIDRLSNGHTGSANNHPYDAAITSTGTELANSNLITLESKLYLV